METHASLRCASRAKARNACAMRNVRRSTAQIDIGVGVGWKSTPLRLRASLAMSRRAQRLYLNNTTYQCNVTYCNNVRKGSVATGMHVERFEVNCRIGLASIGWLAAFSQPRLPPNFSSCRCTNALANARQTSLERCDEIEDNALQC